MIASFRNAVTCPDERTGFVVDVDAILESAQLKNEKAREYVRYWADITGADNV
jgi:hypothetical protein